MYEGVVVFGTKSMCISYLFYFLSNRIVDLDTRNFKTRDQQQKRNVS